MSEPVPPDALGARLRGRGVQALRRGAGRLRPAQLGMRFAIDPAQPGPDARRR